MVDYIFSKQDILQKRAHFILRKLKLIEFLSKFGVPKIVGSVATGLMTWPDIDIDLCANKLDKVGYFKVANYLFGLPCVKRLVLANNEVLIKELKLQGVPKSFYIGVYVKDKDLTWKIDIRFLPSLYSGATEYARKINLKLNLKNKKIILKIKNDFLFDSGHKKGQSADIYKAVLDYNVKNTKDFLKYIKKDKKDYDY